MLGVAQRGVQAGIWHANHHVRLHRVFQRQKSAGTAACAVHAGTVYDRIRPGKIDEFKHAQARFFRRSAF